VKRVDVVCKVPNGMSKIQQLPCTFREFSHCCLSRTSSGPVVCVKCCKLSNNFKGRDVVGSSRGVSKGYLGRLIAFIRTVIVSKQVTEFGLRLTGKNLDSKHDPDRIWSGKSYHDFRIDNLSPLLSSCLYVFKRLGILKRWIFRRCQIEK
jgi:hypothetical protein